MPCDQETRNPHTQAGGIDALGDLGAKSLAEGDVAFFKDAVEELGVR
jgi:hypothetical protein